MPLNYLNKVFREAISEIAPDSKPNLFFEQPKNPEHGDFSTNVSLTMAKSIGMNPRDFALKIIEKIKSSAIYITNLEVAGPGFINVKLSNEYYVYKLQKDVIWTATSYGKQDFGVGKTVNVEYVSVNPTGLLHLGHGRNAVIGDTVANILSFCGYSVVKEYYFNNAGNQMQKLAASIFARYKQIKDESFPFPEDGYHGEYIKEIANDLKNAHQEREINLDLCRTFGEKWCFEKIKATLDRMCIKQDVYYNEDDLYKDGKINDILNDLEAKNLIYEKDGAKWLKFSEIGLKEDRVIIRSNGEPTYRLPDIAYHREKFNRNFDLIVDVFGADHVATIPDVQAALKSLDYDTEKMKVIIHQFVTLTENGEQVKMSKRTGKSYTLDELLDEVGPDVVRFFLLMRSVGTRLEFDLGLAREQSDKNPVFYLQYAQARISAVFAAAEERGISFSLENADFSKIDDKFEIDLIKEILRFGNILTKSAQHYEPQILAEYLRDVASSFHIFYHNCRILGEEESLMYARMGLAYAAKLVLKNGLDILGISSPERM